MLDAEKLRKLRDHRRLLEAKIKEATMRTNAMRDHLSWVERYPDRVTDAVTLELWESERVAVAAEATDLKTLAVTNLNISA